MELTNPVSLSEPAPAGAVSVGPVTIEQARAAWRDAMMAQEKSIRTIETYCSQLDTCVSAQGWVMVEHATLASARAFIATRQRNDHDGRAWENGAVRQFVSALRCFGRFLDDEGRTKGNPFEKLTLPKRREQVHKHPFSDLEALALFQSSLRRMLRDRRARGHAAYMWRFLRLTGLRHSEVQPAGRENPYGGLKWRDLRLEEAYPCIWTDPKWIGNKSKTKDRIPLHRNIAEWLRAHRLTVPCRPDDPVFPTWTNRGTFEDDRAHAGLPRSDQEGRVYTVHALRATFCTNVHELTLPEGLADRLCRHHEGVGEWVYTVRADEAMDRAINQLSDPWPDPPTPRHGGGSNPLTPPNGEDVNDISGISLPTGQLGRYIPPRDSDVPNPRKNTPDATRPESRPGMRWAEPESRPAVAEPDDPLPGVASANPDLRVDLRLVKQTLRSYNRLILLLVAASGLPGACDEPD